MKSTPTPHRRPKGTTGWMAAPGVVTAVLAAAPRALACATCYGASDSPLAEGMNLGILSLLLVILTVLGGIVGFFILLARRAAAVARVDDLLHRAAANATIATCAFLPSVSPPSPLPIPAMEGSGSRRVPSRSGVSHPERPH